MRPHNSFVFFRPIILGACLALTACGGGSGGGSSESPPDGPAPGPAPVKLSAPEASRFLSQATFGPSTQSIEELTSTDLESWLRAEFNKPPSLHLEGVLANFPADGSVDDENGNLRIDVVLLPYNSFWEKAIEGDDQLRQRMAFALSQILVVSGNGDTGNFPRSVAHYMDILTEGAFGNYRDLLGRVTYSPAMSIYLTYFRNQKGDPATGRVPDENYARELLQLFTVGLVELNPDASPVLQADGSQAELYDNGDITELAKVFTGLSVQADSFYQGFRSLPPEIFYSPLVGFDDFHSQESKNFLGVSIPANTGVEQTIELALDGIFAHPNLGPFISRQLIQRFVTSSPAPEYVERVAAVFDAGSYEMPSGTSVGTGERGDLRAVIAAILLDSEARDAAPSSGEMFGKLREPVLRFTHWARAFEVNSANANNELLLRDTSGSSSLGQHPYRSPSVFNFYRPGYIAPGTQTGAAGLTAPELQITNAASLVGYPNILSFYALGFSPQVNDAVERAYLAQYTREEALASDSKALLDHLDLLLTHGTLQPDTRERIEGIIGALGVDSPEQLQLRARIASILVMTAPEYIVLR